MNTIDETKPDLAYLQIQLEESIREQILIRDARNRAWELYKEAEKAYLGKDALLAAATNATQEILIQFPTGSGLEGISYFHNNRRFILADNTVVERPTVVLRT